MDAGVTWERRDLVAAPIVDNHANPITYPKTRWATNAIAPPARTSHAELTR
jgi:hypothetical protein